MRIKCQLVEDGERWRCTRCNWSIARNKFSFMPQRTCRKSRLVSEGHATASPSLLAQQRESIQRHGPERTDAEVLFIITNYCLACPAWSPDPSAKKKCKFCGCGSTETVENLHRRRIRNCPKAGNYPNGWTEASLQKHLHPPIPPSEL